MTALPQNQDVNSSAKRKYLFPLILITSLFFFWGFVHNLDPILIPHLKKAFSLFYIYFSSKDTCKQNQPKRHRYARNARYHLQNQ